MRAILVLGIVALALTVCAPPSVAGPKKQASPAAVAGPKKKARPAAVAGPKKKARPAAVAGPKKKARPAAVARPKKKARPPQKESTTPILCVVDADCPHKNLCQDQICLHFEPGTGLLDVTLETPVEGATLSVDSGPPVALPWAGVVSEGIHQLMIEAVGYERLMIQGYTLEGARAHLSLSLTPAKVETIDDGTPAMETVASVEPTSAPGPSGESSKKPLYVAALFHGGAGVAMWDDTVVRYELALLGGLEFGVRAATPRMAIDIGISARYGEFFVHNVPGENVDFSKWNILVMGLVPRFSFPLSSDGWSLGFEVELGFAMSSLYYLYAALRGHFAYAFTPWLELRANLLGIDWMQEPTGKATFVAYSGNLALVARFP